jgi:hypothetical protein
MQVQTLYPEKRQLAAFGIFAKNRIADGERGLGGRE